LLSAFLPVNVAPHENRQRNLHYWLQHYPLTPRARRGFLHTHNSTTEEPAAPRATILRQGNTYGFG